MRVLRCPFCNHEATAENKLWGHYGRCPVAKASELGRDERRELMLVAVGEWHDSSAPARPLRAPNSGEIVQCPYCDYRGTNAQVLGHCGRRHLQMMPRKTHNARHRRSIDIRPKPKEARGPLQAYWHSYIDSAAERKHEWGLSFEQFAALVTRHCTYCGAPPRSSISYRLPHNGIDRVDSSLGYKPENCVSCCGRCNMMKGRLSHGDFIEQCRRIIAHAEQEAPRIKGATELPTGFRAIKFAKDTRQY